MRGAVFRKLRNRLEDRHGLLKTRPGIGWAADSGGRAKPKQRDSVEAFEVPLSRHEWALSIDWPEATPREIRDPVQAPFSSCKKDVTEHALYMAQQSLPISATASELVEGEVLDDGRLSDAWRLARLLLMKFT